MSPDQPQRLGRYELLEVLGKGAMGVVYRAQDSFLDRIVAVKTYRQDIAITENVRRRFEREVKTASKLVHPNIVTVYDGGLEGDVPFLAMEFVEGSTLQAEMERRGTLPIGEALRILFAICEGLGYAHRAGVIHRDLKPANILLSKSGHPKIADFGVAKVMTSDTNATMTPVGTPSYMSPEQVHGQGVDARADIFALGILAYELVTGRKPFVGDTWTAVLYQIMNIEAPPPSQVRPELPKAFDAAIAHALAKDPAKRTPDIDSFVREVRAAFRPSGGTGTFRREESIRPEDEALLAVDVEGLEAFRDLAPEKSKRPSSRGFGPIALVGVAMIALVAIVGYLASRPAPQPAPSGEAEEAAPAPTATAPSAVAPTAAPTRPPRPTERTAPTATAAPTAPPRPTATARPAPPTRPPRVVETPEQAPPPPPASELPTIDVISEPAGAQVVVDGTVKGTTPLRLADLPAGAHDFEIRKRGYVSYKRAADLDERTHYDMKVTLAAVVNSLRVLSEPPGAEVTIDGTPRGRTPLLLGELKSGSYAVTVTLPGRTPQSETVELDDGELRELKFTFERSGAGPP